MNWKHLTLAIALFIPLAPVRAKTKTVVFTEDEIRAYDAVQSKRKPEEEPLLPQLHRAYPGQKKFTDAEIEALKHGGKDVDFDYKANLPSQHGPAPIDTFSRAKADGYLSFVQKQNAATEDYPKILRQKYGPQDWYTRAQVDDVATNGSKPMQITGALPKDDPVFIAQQRIQPRPNGFRAPRIRQSWRDVLYDEDPSQPENKGKTIPDLVGATLTYTRDGKADSDTWEAIGALILPWEYLRREAGGWGPEKLVLAPSVGVHKVDTNGDPSTETDELLYRLGVYANWRFPTMAGMGVQLRGAAVYVTDTNHRGELPGYEFDVEPRWQNHYFPIGYRRILIPKHPMKEEGDDTSLLDYQLRVWLHMEGGSVQRESDKWDTLDEDFFRMGPTVQLTVSAPYLFFGREFSLTALYSYLSAIQGRRDHESYFNATASLNLYHNPRLGHRISLNLNYERGGLNFTKEDVDTLTLGIGVLF